MKKLLFIIFGLFGVVQAQTIGYLRYDSVKLEKPGSSTELILENSTKGVTGGFLKNTGNGRTAFVVPPSGIDSITRIAGVDSFYYWKNGVSYAVKDSTGGGTTPTWQQTLTAGSTLSTTHTVTSNNNPFIWNWDTKTGGSALTLGINGTAALTGQTVLDINTEGANAAPSKTTYGLKVSNTKTGLFSSNYGAYFTVSGSSNNWAGKFDVSGGTGDNFGIQVDATGAGTVVAAKLSASGGTTNKGLWIQSGIAEFGDVGTNLGQIYMDGSTSGVISIKPQAAAGTYNFNLPTTAGTSGYLLTSGGGGSTAMTWTNPSSLGFANTALSNLASVAINTSLLPGTDNAIDLGSSSKTFKDGYFTGKIGIGNTSPTYDIDLKKTVNGSIGFSVLNESGGASAAAVFNLYRSYGSQYGVQHYYAGEGNTIYTPLSYNMINDVGSTGGMFLNNLASAPIGFLTNNTRRMTILGNGNVGIGESSPSALFSVGSGSKFQVDGNGNVVKLNNVTTSFPSSNSSGVLSNNGSGTLTWATPYIAKTGITTLTGNVAVDIDRTGSGPFKFTIEDNGNRFFTTDKATDTYGFGDLDNAFDNTYMKVVGSVGYIRSSAIASGSTGDAITLVDPSTGELGVAPNLTFNLKKEGTMIYAKNGRIFAEDNSGNNTQISPHNDKGEWIYKSTDKNGVTTEINMIRLAELLEKITGEKLIYKSTDK